MTDRASSAIIDQARKAANLVPVDVTPEDTVRIADAVSAVWKAENERLRAVLVTLSRYDDALRATNWPGLADFIRDALELVENGSNSEVSS